jgi:hypothetical protein
VPETDVRSWSESFLQVLHAGLVPRLLAIAAYRKPYAFKVQSGLLFLTHNLELLN